MNRYECGAGEFATLRRIYMNGDVPVREEKISSPKTVSTSAGSLDGKLLAEACKLRTVGEAQATAEAAANAMGANQQQGKPGVMYADVRAAGEDAKSLAVPVAETAKPEPAAESKPQSAAETKIEVRPPSERPRFIGLPKVDKPQPPAEAEAKAAETKAAAKPMPAKEATPVANITRHERERQLATSGPRAAAPAKPAVKKAPIPQTVVKHHEVHWSYEGEGSPANWAKLKPEYGLCASGKRQSPIDIREGIRVDLEPIQFDYRPTMFRIVDNGHTIQVNVGEGSTMTVMGRSYQLLQFHFHRPSEERVNGKAFEMVIHLVHRDAEGRLAVIAVLLDKGIENQLIQTLWNHMPLEVDQDVTPSVAIDLNALLPENRAYYTYMGSLTTPPCSEDVLWMVFKQPMPVSAEQVGIFSRLYRNNARPIQPSNNRLVKENR
ncbi:MAG: carbonic anhydrase family protein [Rhodocyclales bacterium]|nr:carbonic anhydrase family protein [Rhodocyclales bacterium]